MTLRLQDNTEYPVESLEEYPQLKNSLLDHSLYGLAQQGVFVFPETSQLDSMLDRHQKVLESTQIGYRTSNVVGFIGKDTELLTISSRFSEDNQDFFFHYLVERVLHIPPVVDLQTTMSEEERLYDLLAFLFPFYLKRAMRKGIFRTYVTKHYNDADIKGPLHLSNHIKDNTPFLGKVSYTQRELTEDNEMMLLVRHTLEYLKTRPIGKSILSQIREEQEIIIGYTKSYHASTRAIVIEKNLKNPIRHAYYHEYRALQRLCLMILLRNEHQIGKGQQPIYGVLFDAAWLWEEYLAQLLESVFHHPENRTKSGGQSLFTNKATKRNIGKVYPDFISRQSIHPVIGDAKYKPIQNIHGDDYLQVLAYMFRFDSKRGFYFYPLKQVKSDSAIACTHYQLNKGFTYGASEVEPRSDIALFKLGLGVAYQAKSYERFVEIMSETERQFLMKLNELIR